MSETTHLALPLLSADQAQKQWAVRVAESTVGVERVTDNLVVGIP